MYDALDVANRKTNNIIAHHPQELQDRFYNARERYLVAYDKTERIQSLSIIVGIAGMMAPLTIATFITLGRNVTLADPSGLITMLVGIALTLTIVLTGLFEKPMHMARDWAYNTLEPLDKECDEVTEEVYAYQKNVVGYAFG